ncbi:TetR/AcrR family transcriptional regulator [Mesoterricola silvestris]|uniref:TetR family transcriptional regulator n=1 Tax=Mesoterricola silvestris TaxID=2927979 RepID=A0AA48GU33_9BACT|nr:TetR/AcrR family transcriptional regulator [Mesoterricola silvestris]BDU71791.1 TetR family transcriptional regulator [Mesoterricola silvestris]
MAKERDQQIIEAATSVFLRYGFRRTTMGDIAEAAGISRPALYLRFCNKEKIFEGSMGEFMARTLAEIERGLPERETPLEQLRFAFECWIIQPFLMMQGSPDARDLASCGLAFAEDVKARGFAAFEALLVPILARVPSHAARDAAALAGIARVLAASARGFKAEARDEAELRSMIGTLLELAIQ